MKAVFKYGAGHHWKVQYFVRIPKMSFLYIMYTIPTLSIEVCSWLCCSCDERQTPRSERSSSNLSSLWPGVICVAVCWCMATSGSWNSCGRGQGQRLQDVYKTYITFVESFLSCINMASMVTYWVPGLGVLVNYTLFQFFIIPAFREQQFGYFGLQTKVRVQRHHSTTLT